MRRTPQMFTQAARTAWGPAFTNISHLNKIKRWPPAGATLRRCPAGPLRAVQLRVRPASQEVVDVHLRRDDPPEPGEVQHGPPTNRRAGGLREAGVDSPEVQPSAQPDGGQCSCGATTDPQPHRRADDLGEGMELIHAHGRLWLHHSEDSERAILQGLALVLHLAKAALQVRHLTEDGLQLLLQHYR